MKRFNLRDYVWHPKTKLVGRVVAMNVAGQLTMVDENPDGTMANILPDIPEGYAQVDVQDPLFPGQYSQFVWSIESLEPLEEDEFKLVRDLVAAKRKKTELNKEVDIASAEFARAEQALLEYLNRMAIQGTRQYAGVGQVTIDGTKVYPSITEENRDLAYKEIEALGRGEIIKRTIHPATLESFVNELKETGVPVPAHITVFERPKLSFAKKK